MKHHSNKRFELEFFVPGPEAQNLVAVTATFVTLEWEQERHASFATLPFKIVVFLPRFPIRGHCVAAQRLTYVTMQIFLRKIRLRSHFGAYGVKREPVPLAPRD